MDLPPFFIAIAGDTVALLSGIGSVVLLIFGLASGNKPIPRWFIFLVAAACFFFASARIWTTEHRKYLAEFIKNDELTKPELFGTLRGMLVGHLGVGPEEDRRSLYFVLAETSVGNKGADSIVQSYLMTVNNGGTNVITNDHPTLIPSDIPDVLHGANFGTVKKGSDLFIVTSTPIKRGDIKTGPLLFIFTDQQLASAGGEMKEGSSIKITFQDYLGNSYETISLVYHPGLSQQPEFFPNGGIEPPIFKQRAPPVER